MSSSTNKKAQVHSPALQKGQPLPTRSTYEAPALKNERSLSALPPDRQAREVAPLEAKYTDLVAAEKVPFEFKQHLLPIGAILLFSLVLVAMYNWNSKSQRSVSGNLNDLSEVQYTSQSADYEQEQVCVDQADGTKSCTTKTKLRRSFR